MRLSIESSSIRSASNRSCSSATVQLSQYGRSGSSAIAAMSCRRNGHRDAAPGGSYETSRHRAGRRRLSAPLLCRWRLLYCAAALVDTPGWTPPR
jgi:hypothetical protein